MPRAIATGMPTPIPILAPVVKPPEGAGEEVEVGAVLGLEMGASLGVEVGEVDKVDEVVPALVDVVGGGEVSSEEMLK